MCYFWQGQSLDTFAAYRGKILTNELVTRFPSMKRCCVCDSILSSSVWNGIPIVLNINTKRRKKEFKCIRCATKREFTEKQVNDFLNSREIEVFVK